MSFRYSYAGSAILQPGVPYLFEIRESPKVTFTPRQIVVNCPWFGLVEFVEFTIAGVDVFRKLPIDIGHFDAKEPLLGQLPYFLLPEMKPTDSMVVKGRYNGGKLVPEEVYKMLQRYTLCVRLSGVGIGDLPTW